MKVDKIIIHHSLTADNRRVSWGAIRRYHMQQRRWNNIGYQYGIELVNYDYEILVGRFESETGAHTISQNQNSIGICIVGNFDELKVPERQWQPALRLTRDILKRYELTAADVFGHRDFANKSCPGKLFDMDKFRTELKFKLQPRRFQ
jgi:hypothetical protein